MFWITAAAFALATLPSASLETTTSMGAPYSGCASGLPNMRAAAASMAASRPGRVTTVRCMPSYLPMPTGASYAAAKIASSWSGSASSPV
nr:hypothetical protein [Parafannyhessea umbonata]